MTNGRGGEGGRGGWGEVVGLWLLRRGAMMMMMNIVDKLTANSETVVNTEKNKHFECCSSCY